MSADWQVIAHKPGCEGDCDCPVSENLNITYNLTRMLAAAGLFPSTHWDLMHAPCSEVAGVADGALRRLEADPERFKEMNPPNGWGTYEGAVDFVRDLRDLCAAWSYVRGARLEGWL